MDSPADPRRDYVVGQYRRLVRTGGETYNLPHCLGRVARVTDNLTRDGLWDNRRGTLVNLQGLFRRRPGLVWWVPLDDTEPATEEEWVAQRILDAITS